jgi:hypothetical protein
MSSPIEIVNEHKRRLDEAEQERAALYQVPMTAHDYLKEIYQDPRQPTHLRMRAAIEALAYEKPKLAVTAVVAGQDFAALLDERLRRIEQAKVINGPSHADGDAA